MAKTIEPAIGVPKDSPGRAKDENKLPTHGTARPAGGGTVPRFMNPLERAPKGYTRYRVSCHNYDHHKIEYVLAQSQEEAVAYYRKDSGLDARIALAKGKRTDEPDAPEIVCVVLPD